MRTTEYKACDTSEEFAQIIRIKMTKQEALQMVQHLVDHTLVVKGEEVFIPISVKEVI